VNHLHFAQSGSHGRPADRCCISSGAVSCRLSGRATALLAEYIRAAECWACGAAPGIQAPCRDQAYVAKILGLLGGAGDLPAAAGFEVRLVA
jgi:hypothetical protein